MAAAERRSVGQQEVSPDLHNVQMCCHVALPNVERLRIVEVA
jgi:hypothetical protein